MKKITELNRALENVLNDETNKQASNWVLRKAYQLNMAELEAQIQRIKYTKNEEGVPVARELTAEEEEAIKILEDEKAVYTSGITGMDALLMDFHPTPKDVRIMRLVAFGNRDELEANSVKFGKPSIKAGETKSDVLLGLTALFRNMECFKDAERNNAESTKAYKEAFSALQATLDAFMRWNYCTNNASPSACDHTVVFKDGIEFNVNSKFTKYIASLACFEVRVIKGKLVEAFSERVFFSSLCSWFYIAMTQGDKFKTRYTAPAFVALDDVIAEPAAVTVDKDQSIAE